MASKWNYIFGAITIGVIVGGTIYAIKKSKDVEKLEEEAITLEEARAIVAANKSDEDEEIHFISDIEEVEKVSTVKAVKAIKASEYVEEEYEEEEDDNDGIDENIEGPKFSVTPLIDFRYFEDGINPKEDKTLRFDPNSPEARHQFIRMELSEWGEEYTNPAYRMMIVLCEMPFIPTNPGDELLRTQIIDYKVQFFGWDSRWNKEISFADVIFHYARVAEFNCGESVRFWCEYMFDHFEIDEDSTSHDIETVLMHMCNHTYFNQDTQTFGLFGLTRQQMDEAIRIANRTPGRTLTFEIEFQEFLKSCV